MRAFIMRKMGLPVLALACFALFNGTPWSEAASHPPGDGSRSKGSYQLVGTGPGEGDLLTPRALKAIREADLVFCNPATQEQLSPYVDFKGKEVLDGYGRLFPFYGKDCSQVTDEEKSREKMSCEEYHQKQAEFARRVRDAVAAGKRVVMTSGGDPTLYGPSTWTLRELADLNPSVVPGLSALNAANAALKVSLGEIIITAPFQREGRRDTIENLAGHGNATLVIFMPRDMKGLVARLAKVYPPKTPMAVVFHAGAGDKERVILGTVENMGEKMGDTDAWMSLVYVGKALESAQLGAEPKKPGGSKGKFHLVGTGPGDADLATLRALKVMEEADLVFARKNLEEKFLPQLKGKKVLDGYGRLFPFYGKDCSKLTEAEKSRESMSCEDYHRKQAEFATLVREAVARGERVVMLDNGDPLIYGPCSWTLTELRDLETEVVPGLSAFNAGNAALRVGVTEGKNSHSVILASGWTVDEMAVHKATMVLFTMRTEFRKFIDSLSRHYPPETPVAVVVNAGYSEKEQVIHGNLGTILQQIGEGRLPFEHLLYVGDFLTGLPKEGTQAHAGFRRFP